MSQTLHLQDNRDPETQKRRVFFATPAYTGAPSGIHQYAMLGTIAALERIEDIGWEWCLLMHNCHVDDARNTLIRNFRASDCTDLFFIDADNGWDPKDVIRFLRMDDEFVAGVYPYKTFDDSDYPCHVPEGDINAYKRPGAPEGLVPALRVPTGFMRLRRSVIDKMIKKYGTRQHKGGDHQEGMPPTVVLFERSFGPDPAGDPDDDRRWGGDLAFCNLWRAIGGEIWIDPHVTLRHAGPWVWEGNVGDHWKKKTGQDKVEEKERLGRIVEKIMADPVAASKDTELIVDYCATWKNPWALPPDQLSTAMSLALESDGPTLECGTGLSTIALAACAKHTGKKHYALEHSRWFSALIAVHLRRYGLTKHCEVIMAELAEQDGGEWYEVHAELPDDFGFLLIDGPPQEDVVSTRWRALDHLHGNLAPGASILVDDVDQKGWGNQLKGWEALLSTKFHIMQGKPRQFAVAKLPATTEVSEAS